MQWLDEKIRELEQFRPPLTKRPDFAAFWQKTREQTNRVPLHPDRQLVEHPISNITVFDISYCGFDDTPIHGWFILQIGRASCRERV